MATTAYTIVRVNDAGKVVKGGEHRINKRTLAYLDQVKKIYALLGGTGVITIAQGSYNKGVSQSAGTHDGGGSLDLYLSKNTAKNWAILQKACRMCMGAAWWRKPLYRNGKLVWSNHVHLEIIGDKDMALGGRKQVQDYYAELDGLASHARDKSWRPSVLFSMSYPLPTIDHSNMVREARKTKGMIAMPGVKQIQSALNLKSGANLKVDGIYGKTTKAAYKRWESSFSGAKADGVPGPFTLALLGAGRFNVTA